jgi:hypothetical protein
MTQTLPAGVEIVGKITPSVQEVLPRRPPT